jgi:OmpA-OmpF porin, OOP family
MIDKVLNEATSLLGDKGTVVVTALIEFMFQDKSQGLHGFIARAKSAGLGVLVEKWRTSSDPLPLSSDVLLKLIPASFLNSLRSSTGMSLDTLQNALCHILPKTFATVTRDGIIPKGIPAALLPLLKGTSVIAPFANSESKKKGIGFLLPASACALAAFLWLGVRNSSWFSMSRPTEEASSQHLEGLGSEASARAALNPSVLHSDQVIQKEPTLSASNDNGILRLSGVLNESTLKESILVEAESVYGKSFVTSELSVDGSVAPSRWSKSLRLLFETLKEQSGTRVVFDGLQARLEGILSAEMKVRLEQVVRGLLGDSGKIVSLIQTSKEILKGAVKETTLLETSSDKTPQASEVKESALRDQKEDSLLTTTQAQDKLLALTRKKEMSLQQVNDILNKTIISFATSRAVLTDESKGLLQIAAKLLKEDLVTNQVVEIAGHTDSSGAAKSNDALSLARAEAVRNYLVGEGVSGQRLVARGYGSSVPVNDNTTEQGRAKNRRIEFSFVSSKKK